MFSSSVEQIANVKAAIRGWKEAISTSLTKNCSKLNPGTICQCQHVMLAIIGTDPVSYDESEYDQSEPFRFIMAFWPFSIGITQAVPIENGEKCVTNRNRPFSIGIGFLCTLMYADVCF